MSASVCRFTSATGISTSISRLVELSFAVPSVTGLSALVLSLISAGLTITFPMRQRQRSRHRSAPLKGVSATLSVKTHEEQRQTAEGGGGGHLGHQSNEKVPSGPGARKNL